ncbi:MAG TPA: hypothetical protein VJV03_16130 [Pyrinomonadaceae bacterium]|nr:hypothetical protein [Pyrinomonadaceae bacterium]
MRSVPPAVAGGFFMSIVSDCYGVDPPATAGGTDLTAINTIHEYAN